MIRKQTRSLFTVTVNLILLFGTPKTVECNTPYRNHYANNTLFIGTVQFPKELHSVPALRARYKGSEIAYEFDNVGKKANYSFTENKRATTFHLVIAESIQLEVDEHNIIHHQKITPEQPHKFYTLMLKKTPVVYDDHVTQAVNRDDFTYEWIIQEDSLANHEWKIPDDALIIVYPPEYISHLESSSYANKLPTIVIKNGILNTLSEKELHKKSDELIIASFSNDAFYARPSQQRQEKYSPKTIIAFAS